MTLSQGAQRRLNHHTRVRSASEARAAAALSGTPDQIGKWGPVVNWPVVAIFTSLLRMARSSRTTRRRSATETYPDADLHAGDRLGSGHRQPDQRAVNTGYNIFCSGLAHLVDGTVFIAGGNMDPQFDGIVQTHLFDPATNTWSLGPNMAAGAGTRSVTADANGEMLITSGGPADPRGA